VDGWIDTMRGFLEARATEQARAVGERTKRLRAALPAMVAYLGNQGATRVWLIGSLAWGQAHARSDLDLAVEGLPVGERARTLVELWRLAGTESVDLILIESAGEGLARRIRMEGQEIGR
jgi:predicted nucleotidyltransferase